MRIFVTGASGLVGSGVCEALLKRGDDVTALSRSARTSTAGGVSWVEGDPSVAGDWCREIDGQDAVIHLAGESVAAGRWTKARKARLVDSRIESTRCIASAIEAAASKPHTFVCASATGYYGSRGEELLEEGSEPGTDFLATLCCDWEAAAQLAANDSLRVASVRFAVVLSGNGGALANMLPPFRLGLGGPLGPKDRWFPWIHETDAIGLVLHALDTAEIECGEKTQPFAGPINLSAPGTVRMGEFSKTLGRVLRRPAFFSVPLGLLKIPLGEFADLISPGQRVSAARAVASGYDFAYPDLESALRACLK